MEEPPSLLGKVVEIEESAWMIGGFLLAPSVFGNDNVL
jgi:hypothetical protein